MGKLKGHSLSMKYLVHDGLPEGIFPLPRRIDCILYRFPGFEALFSCGGFLFGLCHYESFREYARGQRGAEGEYGSNPARQARVGLVQELWGRVALRNVFQLHAKHFSYEQWHQ